MRRSYLIFFAFCAMFVTLLLPTKGQKYETMWKKVTELRAKDLPASAAKEVHNIYVQARKNGNDGQMLTAILTEMQLKADISPDSVEAYIDHFNEMLKKEKAGPVRALLHLVLGNLYASQNSRIEDSAQIKSIEHLRLSMESPDILASENALKYIPFILKGEDSKYFNNDLLSVVAKTATDCLAGIRNDKMGASVLLRDIFHKELSVYRKQGNREAEFFVLLDSIETKENESPVLFRQMPEQDADDSEETDRKAEYENVIKRFGDLDICVEAYIRLALNGEAKISWNWAQEGIRRYPKAKRTEVLRNRLKSLSTPTLNATFFSKNFYPGKRDSIEIVATNLTQGMVHFYRFPFAAKDNVGKKMGEKGYAKYMVNPILEIPITLHKGEPCQEIKDTIAFTAPAVGRYLVQVTSEKVKSQIYICTVSAMRLSLFALPESKVRAWVTDAETGKPLPDVCLNQMIPGGNYSLAHTFNTDANGVVIISTLNENYIYFAEKDRDNGLEGMQIYGNGENFRERMESITYSLALFTDRSIYRPGQKVQIGGFLYEKQGDKVQVKANADVKLQLLDANLKKVGEEKMVKTDKFGAISANFLLPESCLNGTFRIRSEYGNTFFRVEAYKRPTFIITFQEIGESYKAGDTVRLKGMVKTYTGFPLPSVKVGVVVKRQSSPWLSLSFGSDQTILSDTVVTDEKGNFIVPVSLIMPKQNKINKKIFGPRYCLFRTTATVTSDNGETEEGEKNLFAGDHPVVLSADIPQRICKELKPTLQVTQRNAAFAPVEGKGLYKILQGRKTVLQGKIDFNRPIDSKAFYALPSGEYVLDVVPEGIQDTAVQLQQKFVLFSLNDKKPIGDEKLQVYASSSIFERGESVKVMAGSPLKDAYIFCDRYEGCKLVSSKLVHFSDETFTETLSYKESYGNGVQLFYVLVRDGKVYKERIEIRKPEPDKELNLRWSSFRDRLSPGQKEEWRLQVLRNDKPVQASVIATLYDASLDKFAKLPWAFSLGFNRFLPWIQFESSSTEEMTFNLAYPVKYEYETNRAFNKIDENILNVPNRFYALGLGGQKMTGRSVMMASPNIALAESNVVARDAAMFKTNEKSGIDVKADKENKAVRNDFNETAFFSPRLTTDEQGEAVIAFMVPQSLTTWNFRALAHTEDLNYGSLDTSVVVQKKFMVQPNIPRFLRVGDRTELAVSLQNASNSEQKGKVNFELIDPQTQRILEKQTAPFAVAPSKLQTISFAVVPTEKYPVLICRIFAENKSFSDGEQHFIPILEDKQDITESIPLTFTKKGNHKIELSSLLGDHNADRTHQRITVEYTANPAWMAIEALPSMVKPYDNNALSLASSFYALSLATLEAQAHPSIRKLAETWQRTQHVDSVFLMLDRNPDLKQIVLNETPWVGAAEREEERCKHLAELFDSVSVSYKRQSYLDRLVDLQTANGSWSWFRGMPGNMWMTIEVSEILARLQTLSPAVMTSKAQQALNRAIHFMDEEAAKYVDKMREEEKKTGKKAEIETMMLRYLYICGLQEYKSTPDRKFLVARLAASAIHYDIYAKSLAARVLVNTGNEKAAKLVLQSLMEYTTYRKDLGRYFDTRRAPSFKNSYRIPTQVAALETLDKLAPNDSQTILDMTRWLLQSKRTETWDNPVATVEAVYYLFNKRKILQQSENMSIPQIELKYVNDSQNHTLHNVSDNQGTATLGYFRSSESVDKRESLPIALSVDKTDNQLSFGAVYAQYTLPMNEIKSSAAGLSLVCKYSVQRGVNWVAVTPSMELLVGEKLRVRYELTADRDYDFVCLKAGRAACMEPVQPLSGYLWWQSCYREVDDASIQYFFQQVTKGKLVLEDDMRIDRAGRFISAVPTVQCIYSPEFFGRGEALHLTVKSLEKESDDDK